MGLRKLFRSSCLPVALWVYSFIKGSEEEQISQGIWARRLRFGGRVIAVLFPTLTVLLYLLLLGSSHVYVTGSLLDGAFPLWSNLRELGLPGIATTGTEHVSELNILHASRNLVFVFSSILLMTYLPVLAAVAGIGMMIYGLLTLEWASLVLVSYP